MLWSKGLYVLKLLEEIKLSEEKHPFSKDNFYMSVQLVIRPDHTFRGIAGQVAKGHISVGDKVVVLPSLQSSSVKEILMHEKHLKESCIGESVVMVLADDIDVSRGDVLVAEKTAFNVVHAFVSDVVWLGEKPLAIGKQYWLKMGAFTCLAWIEEIIFLKDMLDLKEKKSQKVKINDIARVRISVGKQVVIAPYLENKTAGSFILVDKFRNDTLAAGMVLEGIYDEKQDLQTLKKKVKLAERLVRLDQKPALFIFTGIPGSAKIVLARALERFLFDKGYFVYTVDPENFEIDRHAEGETLRGVTNVFGALLDLGVVVFSTYTFAKKEDRSFVLNTFASQNIFEVFFDIDVEKARKRLLGLGRDPDNALLSYEKPHSPNLIIDANDLDVSEQLSKQLDRLYRFLQKKGLLH